MAGAALTGPPREGGIGKREKDARRHRTKETKLKAEEQRAEIGVENRCVAVVHFATLLIEHNCEIRVP